MLVAFLLLVSLAAVTGQKSACDRGKMDECFNWLMMIGEPAFRFPESKTLMDEHCRKAQAAEKCVKDYNKNCLKGFVKQSSNVLVYGVAKTNKGYCASKRRRSTFVEMSRCGNAVKDAANKCMVQLIDKAYGAVNEKDPKRRIPMTCCNYFKAKQCILAIIQKKGPPTCTEKDYTEYERLIDGFAQEVLNFLCGEYTEDSDKCEKLVRDTPKKLRGQGGFKSLLPPLIDVLVSVTDN